MTVSDFAVKAYEMGIVKDLATVIVKNTGEVLYSDRMEFLRYVSEYNKNMLFVDKEIRSLEMLACPDPIMIDRDEDGDLDYYPDYETIFYI